MAKVHPVRRLDASEAVAHAAALLASDEASWISGGVFDVAGDIAVAPPNTPHKFKAIGHDVARLICIHASPTIVGEWLE